MQKRYFETYQKRFRDFEILPKFSETHVFRGTIRHPQILQHIKNPRGEGVPSTPSPCTTVAVWLCVYVRELKNVKKKKKLPPLTTNTNNKKTGYNQRRSTNLILTGWSGTVSSFWRKSSGSWWYSKRNLWSNCSKEKWRIRGIDISEITLFSACERCRRILSSLLSTRKVTLRVKRSNVRKYVCVRSRLHFYVPSRAQLFEGQLALNPGLNLTPVSSLVFKSILSHNFLCYF